ncbi:hypothetical protein P692DRAFT_20825875 [Suillus brevipes Sb2]|nr:hypothetical protein P692DRAFT_20825875 [Suillus brevipes Sb2]
MTYPIGLFYCVREPICVICAWLNKLPDLRQHRSVAEQKLTSTCASDTRMIGWNNC